MRDKGDRFEKEVANKLNLETTAKSGGHWDDADLYAYNKSHPLSLFIIECKYKEVDWLRPVKSEIKKVMKQAEKINKDWMYVQGNNAGDFVVMSLDALAELLDSK